MLYFYRADKVLWLLSYMSPYNFHKLLWKLMLDLYNLFWGFLEAHILMNLKIMLNLRVAHLPTFAISLFCNISGYVHVLSLAMIFNKQ